MNNLPKKLVITILVVGGLILASYLVSLTLSFEGFEGKGNNKIAIIPIKGVLTSEGSTSFLGDSTSSSRSIVEFIDQAEKDKDVKGIILEINSPGGTVLAGKEVADSVKNTKKPTVALIRDVGASGAYWVASAADKIVADEMSITGSVGVTSSYLEFSGLMSKYGVGYEEIKGGEYKEAGNPFRKLTPKEEAMLQSKVDIIHNYFLNEVKNNRKLDNKTIEDVSKAGVYLGVEAHGLGLVDYLGNKDTAIKVTQDLAGIDSSTIVVYEKERGLFTFLEGLSTRAFYDLGRGIGTEMFNRENTRNMLEINA